MQVAPAPEAVQIEAAPTQAAPKLVIAESAPAAASAEMAAPKLQEKAKENELAKTKPTKPETDTAPQVSIEAPADKTILAGAPEEASRQASEKEAESIRPKEAVVTAEVAPPAPVAAAPAPQPAIASADAASGQTLARAAAKPEPMNKATKKMEDAAQTQPELKADLPSAIGAAKPAVQSSALALALGRQGGQTLANADIQAGKLRILSLSNKAASGSVDDATGYRKEEVIVEDEANLKSLAAEVEAYNQTMREWYLNN